MILSVDVFIFLKLYIFFGILNYLKISVIRREQSNKH